MTIKLSDEILNKFLISMEQDLSIGKKLAKKLCDAISAGDYGKDAIESILKIEAENNENT